MAEEEPGSDRLAKDAAPTSRLRRGSGHPTIAIDKAFTAAAAKKATHDYGTASQPGAPAYGINSAIGGRLMVVGGGLPVLFEGEVVGGIGVSSGTPAQDQAVAEAGIAYWRSHG